MKVKGLNDTKAVAGAVYVTSITFTVLFVSTYSVVEYINVYAAIFSVALFVGTSAILVLLYIPKVSYSRSQAPFLRIHLKNYVALGLE